MHCWHYYYKTSRKYYLSIHSNLLAILSVSHKSNSFSLAHHSQALIACSPSLAVSNQHSLLPASACTRIAPLHRVYFNLCIFHFRLRVLVSLAAACAFHALRDSIQSHCVKLLQSIASAMKVHHSRGVHSFRRYCC